MISWCSPIKMKSQCVPMTKAYTPFFFVIITVLIYPPAVDTEQCHNMMMIRVQIGRSKCCLRLQLYSRTFYNTSWSITYHSRTNQAITARNELQNKYDFFFLHIFNIKEKKQSARKQMLALHLWYALRCIRDKKKHIIFQYIVEINLHRNEWHTKEEKKSNALLFARMKNR